MVSDLGLSSLYRCKTRSARIPLCRCGRCLHGAVSSRNGCGWSARGRWRDLPFQRCWTVHRYDDTNL